MIQILIAIGTLCSAGVKRGFFMETQYQCQTRLAECLGDLREMHETVAAEKLRQCILKK